MVSKGWVMYTVMTPAVAPIPNVSAGFFVSLMLVRDETISFMTLYEPMRTADVADCFIVVESKPRYTSLTPDSATIVRRA